MNSAAIKSANHKEEKYAIRVLERAIRILLCFVHVASELTIDDIVEATGIPKSTTYRCLVTLELQGLLERDSQREVYRLGTVALLLGTTALNQMELHHKMRPYLEQLMKTTGETVHLAVQSQDRVVVIDKVDSHYSIRMASTIGYHSPMHSTGVGKVLLAYQEDQEVDRLLNGTRLQRFTPNTTTDPNELKQRLAQIRRQGFALDQEEVEIGLRCVAAPIRDHAGRVVASVSISGPSNRISEESLPRFISVVKEHASRMSQELGYQADVTACK